MDYRNIFERYELKYFLTLRQKERLLSAMEPFMDPDCYGRTVIRNLYYDTDTFLLARRSIASPVYKEKMRIRSYGRAEETSPVFVELKKKYDGVVFKRRISLPQDAAMDWSLGKIPCPEQTQISREIDCFMRHYPSLAPTVFLSYEREAFFAKDASDFRVTFDEQIRFRTDRLSLCSDPDGRLLLPEGKVLMELKCASAIPLWMVRLLSEMQIYKTSYSKYGQAYITLETESQKNRPESVPV